MKSSTLMVLGKRKSPLPQRPIPNTNNKTKTRETNIAGGLHTGGTSDVSSLRACAQKPALLLFICFGVFMQAMLSQGGTPQGGTTIGNIEQLPGWQSCDTCSGGGKVSYSMTQGLDFPERLTTRFSIGHGSPWSHALWWKRLGNNPNISHFVIRLDQYIEDPASSWGIEYNVNQLLNNQWFKFSTQCSFGDGIWQVWDSAHKRWTRTSVPCLRPAPSTHTQLRMDYERINGRAHFLAITIGNQVYRVDRSFDPQPIDGRNGDFGVHFQLNGNKQSAPYSVWIHDFQLTYW